MVGLGTIINVAAIILGGLLGKLCSRFLSGRYQDTLSKTCGVCVLFIAIGGAMEGILSINGNAIVSGKSLLIICCLALGALLGELCNLEDKFEQFGEWLKNKTGNAKEKTLSRAL